MCEYLVQAMTGARCTHTKLWFAHDIYLYIYLYIHMLGKPTDPVAATAGEGPGATFHLRPGRWQLQHEQV
jgi:hypothetical protein